MKVMQKVWTKHGALQYFQCAGDQLDPGPTTSFPKTVKLKKGEAVIVGFAFFKNKAQFMSTAEQESRYKGGVRRWQKTGRGF